MVDLDLDKVTEQSEWLNNTGTLTRPEEDILLPIIAQAPDKALEPLEDCGLLRACSDALCDGTGNHALTDDVPPKWKTIYDYLTYKCRWKGPAD